MILLLFLALIPIYKYCMNRKYYKECIEYETLFKKWLKDPKSEPSIIRTKARVLILFKGAHIKERYVPISKDVGYGTLQVRDTPVLYQYPSRVKGIYNALYSSFEEAIGYYKNSMEDSYDLFYWINFFIFLPKNISKYMGLSTSNIWNKIIQVIYWLIGFICTILLGLYPKIIRRVLEDVYYEIVHIFG
jgi:hypothetical protein